MKYSLHSNGLDGPYMHNPTQCTTGTCWTTRDAIHLNRGDRVFCIYYNRVELVVVEYEHLRGTTVLRDGTFVPSRYLFYSISAAEEFLDNLELQRKTSVECEEL